MADEAGVKLTKAGATYPYGKKDPRDRNIRLAPSFPPLAPGAPGDGAGGDLRRDRGARGGRGPESWPVRRATADGTIGENAQFGPRGSPAVKLRYETAPTWFHMSTRSTSIA